MVQIILKCFFTGWVILIVAILLNYICNWLQISTWYDFLLKSGEVGLGSAWAALNWVSIIYLVVIYPIILGGVGYFLLKWIS